MKHIQLFGLLVAVTLIAGCAKQKFLVEDSLIAGRSLKTVLIPADAQTDNKQVIYDYHAKLCDLDTAGSESTCKDTVILTNVIPQSIY